MRLEQLYFLIEVYKSKSISLAAERAHISQPAISSSLSKLEDELGVLLLKRTNQGVYPTDIGELIINKAIKIVEITEEIKALAKGSSADLQGDMSIAAEPGFNITLMPNILIEFKQNYPKVNVILKVGESNNILRDIKAGKADFGIILKTEEFSRCSDISHVELFNCRLVIISGKNCPIAGDSLTLREALALPLVLYNTEYITNCGVSTILRKFGEINVSFRVDNLEMLDRILAQGKNVAFVPRFMATEYAKNGKIKIININDIHLEVQIILIWSNRHHLSSAEKEFTKIIKAMCAKKKAV